MRLLACRRGGLWCWPKTDLRSFSVLKLTLDQKRTFADAVAAAIRSPLLSTIDDCYRRFEVERALRKPSCSQSGKCCRFEEYGHRLFVTTLEMARFWQHVAPTQEALPSWNGSGCPYQVDRLCLVHPARPFGCRAYFCDPSSTRWQNDQYERFHGEIRELHHRADVPYLYVEWREALDALGVSPSARRDPSASLVVLQ